MAELPNKGGSQLVRILKHLQSGKELTVAEARARFGVRNLSARVFELRSLGFGIFSFRKKLHKGTERVTAYLLDPRS